VPEPPPARNGRGFSAGVWISVAFGSLFPGQLPHPSFVGVGTSSGRDPITRPECWMQPGRDANRLSDLVPSV